MVSGGYGGGDIPVPIPNTAVKPTSADGTWGSPPGRVGRRRDFLKTPHLLVGGFRFGVQTHGESRRAPAPLMGCQCALMRRGDSTNHHESALPPGGASAGWCDGLDAYRAGSASQRHEFTDHRLFVRARLCGTRRRDALTAWLAPAGMSGRFERFGLRPGGHIAVLRYDDRTSARGKAKADSDIIEARHRNGPGPANRPRGGLRR